MSTSFAATERERYEELLDALMELAKALMTFHTLATLDAADLTDLAVENLTALLDDAVTARDQQGPAPAATAGPAPNGSTAGRHRLPAAQQRRLDDAIRRTKQALQGAAVARIDAQAPAVRDQLVHGISSVMEAFRQLAAAPGADPALAAQITRMTQTLDQSWRGFLGLGYARTAALSDHPVYLAIYRSALELSVWSRAREAWRLWAGAAYVRRWAAAQAGDRWTLALAHATDAKTYLDRGLLDQAERHYEVSRDLRVRLDGDRAVEWIDGCLAEVKRRRANANRPRPHRDDAASDPAASPTGRAPKRDATHAHDRSPGTADATTHPGSAAPSARQPAARPARPGRTDHVRETTPPGRPAPADSPTDQQPAAGPDSPPAEPPATTPSTAPPSPAAADRWVQEVADLLRDRTAAPPRDDSAAAPFRPQPRPPGSGRGRPRRPPGAARMSSDPAQVEPGEVQATQEPGPTTPAAGQAVPPDRGVEGPARPTHDERDAPGGVPSPSAGNPARPYWETLRRYLRESDLPSAEGPTPAHPASQGISSVGDPVDDEGIAPIDTTPAPLPDPVRRSDDPPAAPGAMGPAGFF